MSWQLASFVVLGAVLAGGFAWYERSRPPARVLALVAALAALAVVGRIAFAPIPNVKPTTDIALFAGYALGPVPGFAVGAVAAVVSNVFFGQGPWTPWQMAGWGLAGVMGGALAAVAGRDLGRTALAAACAFAGAAFGALLDLYQWTQGAAHDLPAYLAWSASSLPYNLAHVLGNIAFCLLLGPAFVRSLRRYRRRFEARWAPAAAAVLAVAAIALAPAPDARAASSTARATAYLERAQNADGGFGGAPGASSNSLHTGWAALGLAGAGVNPADVKSGGNSIVDYVRAHLAATNDVGELERTVLVVEASGLDARDFGGRNLVRELLRRRSRNGSWKGNNTWTSFGILALRASHAGGAGRSARWLARRQNRDGGFGFSPRAASSIDDTSAALEGLAAAGRRRTRTVRRAVAFLRRSQNRDGGFPLMRRQTSNSQSTAWAVQGLVAAGRRPSRFRRSGGRTPLGYLRSLQSADGSIRFSRFSRQTPVWTTAQALDALALKAFPLRAPPRRARHAAGSKARAKSAAGAGARPNARRAGRKAGRAGAAPAAPAAPKPAGPEPASSPAAAAAARAAQKLRDDGGFAWGPALAAAALTAVAAFAAWRLARRRGRPA
jgi:energy-coupling factor transport system substrate-specific component